jgi:hypothetical protein
VGSFAGGFRQCFSIPGRRRGLRGAARMPRDHDQAVRHANRRAACRHAGRTARAHAMRTRNLRRGLSDCGGMLRAGLDGARSRGCLEARNRHRSGERQLQRNHVGSCTDNQPAQRPPGCYDRKPHGAPSRGDVTIAPQELNGGQCDASAIGPDRIRDAHTDCSAQRHSRQS